MKRRFWPALFVTAMLAAASLVRAQEGSMPPQVRAEARRILAECEAHHDAERFAVAAECWGRLYDFMTEHRLPRAPVALWNIGHALARVPGREREAREALQRFLDESTAIADGDDVQGWRSEAAALIGELDARMGSAASSAEMPPEVRAQGRRLQEQAMAHVDAHRWALAADAFRQMYELGREHNVPRAPIALWDLGLALMRIPGREAEAREAFRRFLDESTTLTDDAEVRDWRSTALEHIAELDARTPRAQDAQPERAASSSVSPIGPIIAAVGAGAMLAGSITGGVALAQDGSARADCDETRCTPEAYAAIVDAHSLAIATDALLWGGLGVLAAGVVLTFVLRDGGETTASVGCSGTGCAGVVEGRF